MIIKVYARDDDSKMRIIIYTNIDFVEVKPVEKLRASEINKHEIIFKDWGEKKIKSTDSSGDEDYWIVRPIECGMDGRFKVIYVANTAYICGDEGGIIEKVTVDNYDLLV